MPGARRTAGRTRSSSMSVEIDGRPDFTPGDYTAPPPPGWNAETLWAACWAYADEHAQGARGAASTAFRNFARAYDRARDLTANSTRSVVRQDIEARLRGVDYAERGAQVDAEPAPVDERAVCGY